MRSRRALRLIVMSVGGAVLLFLVWMLLWYGPTPGPVPLDVPDASRVPAASGRTTESAASSSDTANLPATVQPRDSITPPDDTPRVPYRETVVRVMNDEGAPVAGASVACWHVEPAISGFGLEYHQEGTLVQEGRTSDAGEVRLVLLSGTYFDLRVTAEAYGSQVLRRRVAGERITVVLEAGCTLAGRFHWRGSGEAPAGVRLDVLQVTFAAGRPLYTWLVRETVPVADEFRFAGLPPGETRLTVRSPRIGQLTPDPIELKSGETIWLDIDLQPGVKLEGRVVDGVTGAPIHGAEVSSSFFALPVRTDEDGRFALVYRDRPQLLRVRAAGYSPSETSGGMGTPIAAVTLELFRPRSLTGRVETVDQQPVVGASVWAVAKAEVMRGFVGRSHTVSGVTTERGEYTLAVRPDLQYTLVVLADGLARPHYVCPRFPEHREELVLPTVLLEPESWLEGTVEDARGRPVADTIVTLRGGNGDRFHWIGNLEPATYKYIRKKLNDQQTRSDAEGRFIFTGLCQGMYELNASIRGASEDQSVVIRGPDVVESVVVTFPEGAGLGGRLVDAHGRGVRGALIVVTPLRFGKPLQMRTDTEGRFGFTGLFAGRYDLEARHWNLERKRLAKKNWEVETGHWNLELQFP